MIHLKMTVLVSVLLFSHGVFADDFNDVFSIGEEVVIPLLTDQFDQKHVWKKETAWLVFTHDMESGYMIKEAFEGLDDGKLAKASIQYYSDISTMPGFVLKLFMLPKFKTLSYAMILGRETIDLEHLPRKAGKAMLMKMSNGKLVNLLSTNDPKFVQKTLHLPTIE